MNLPELKALSVVYDEAALTVSITFNRSPTPEELEGLREAILEDDDGDEFEPVPPRL